MQDFLKLQVWHKANAVGFDVHRFATRIRGRDNGALKGQLQRSAPAIADAIAEGAGKVSNAEFARYLDIALGSASETHSQLISARQRALIDDAQFNEFADRVTEVRKMLFGLMKKVRDDDSRPPDAAND